MKLERCKKKRPLTAISDPKAEMIYHSHYKPDRQSGQ